MFMGRVVLPAIGLLVAVSLAWQSVRSMTAHTEVIRLGDADGLVAHSIGRITAEGRVVSYPGAEVTVGTEVLGTIISMPAHEKGTVRRGDLLVEIRADDVRASLREGRFRLIETETSLRLLRARFQLDRIFPSLAAKTPPGTDTRVEEHAAAVAHRDAARAAVERLEAELVKYRITAPIDGVVVCRQVDPGETVTPAAPLLTVVDLSRLRVEAEIDEYDITRVAPGARVIITAEGYSGRHWQGEVEEVADVVAVRHTRPEDPGKSADARVLRVQVGFREPNPLKLGQRVEVDIATGPETNNAAQIAGQPRKRRGA
jgi:RND family efflux transporter MFP subunit